MTVPLRHAAGDITLTAGVTSDDQNSMSGQREMPLSICRRMLMAVGGAVV